jgi:probable F420-dependent oxidoreductase
MQLGVNVPNFGQGTSPEVLAEWAQVAEGLGFDVLMMSDHVAVTADVARSYPAPFFDPFATLAWLAGQTKRIWLGTTVLVVPYRSPLLTAQLSATLQLLSGGRLVLGIGVGWARQEFDALGLRFDQRGAVTDDHLAALRTLWTAEVAEHHGPAADFSGVHGSLAGRTAPPLWIGGNGRPALRRVARLGDAWHPLGLTLAELRAGLAWLREEAEAGGAARRGFAPRIKFRLTPAPAPAPGDDRQPGIGTLSQVTADLEQLRDLGAQAVILDPYHGDPAETRDPRRAWADLAAIRAACPPGRESAS